MRQPYLVERTYHRTLHATCIRLVTREGTFPGAILRLLLVCSHSELSAAYRKKESYETGALRVFHNQIVLLWSLFHGDETK